MSGITAEAIDKVNKLAEPNLSEHHGATYTDKNLSRIMAPRTKCLNIHTLTGLIDYLKSNLDNLDYEVYHMAIHIKDYDKVNLVSNFNVDLDRNLIIAADLPSSMQFSSIDHLNQEQAIIALQTRFQPTDNLKMLLEVVGHIVASESAETQDNGISQQVTVKKGSALRERKDLPNPIELKPWRTFREIDQPISKFVIRLDDKMRISLIEAGGEMWKLEAINFIKDYFTKEIEKHAIDKTIVIIA